MTPSQESNWLRENSQPVLFCIVGGPDGQHSDAYHQQPIILLPQTSPKEAVLVIEHCFEGSNTNN